MSSEDWRGRWVGWCYSDSHSCIHTCLRYVNHKGELQDISICFSDVSAEWSAEALCKCIVKFASYSTLIFNQNWVITSIFYSLSLHCCHIVISHLNSILVTTWLLQVVGERLCSFSGSEYNRRFRIYVSHGGGK